MVLWPSEYYCITQSIKYSRRTSPIENERSSQLKRKPVISDHRGNVQIASLDSHFPELEDPFFGWLGRDIVVGENWMLGKCGDGAVWSFR